MRKILTFFLLVFLLGNFSQVCGEETIMLRETKEAPVIDGQIEKLWGKPAIPYLITCIPNSKAGETPDNKTKVYLLYDEAYLYLAFACAEEEMEGLVTSRCKERDGSWGDDGIEIFLDPGRTKRSFYQIMINADGIIADIKYPSPGQGNKKWDSNILVKTRKGKKGWTAEVKIPWADFAADNDITGIWGINLNRWEPRKRTGQSWASMIGGFHQLDKFKVVKFNLNPENYCYRLSNFTFGALSFGDNILTAKIKNIGKKRSKVVAEIRWQISEGKLNSRLKHYLLKPGEIKKLSLNYPLKQKGEKGKIIFRLLNPKDKFCHLEEVKYFTIPSSLLTLKIEKVYYLSDSRSDLEVKINLGENTRKKSLLLITPPGAKEETFRKKIPSPSNELTVPIDISKLGVGEHKILVELFDIEKNLLESKEITFKCLKNPF